MANQQLLLHLLSVHCGDETRGKWQEKVGNDEISLSGFGFAPTGETVMVPPFRVYANFDDGETFTFSPPKTILTLNIPDDGVFPKHVRSTLLLWETDENDEAKMALATEEIARKKREQELKGDLWGELAEWVWKEIVAGLPDDMFPPQDVPVLSISSGDFYWGDGTKLSPEETVTFEGHDGKYYVKFYREIQTL